MSGDRFLRPGAQLGLRDDAFAAAMRRAEQKAKPPVPDTGDEIIGLTRAGVAVRRNGECFIPGPFLNTSDLPIVG